MPSQRVWSAEELEAMSPDERDAVVRDGFVTDPDEAPPELLERARNKADKRILQTEQSDTTQ